LCDRYENRAALLTLCCSARVWHITAAGQRQVRITPIFARFCASFRMLRPRHRASLGAHLCPQAFGKRSRVPDGFPGQLLLM